MKENMILKYRGPGKRPGTSRWEQRGIASVQAAVDFMNQNKSVAWLPAHVFENTWKKEIVAIFN